MNKILAIDPGSSSGALALIDMETLQVDALNMPNTYLDIWDDLLDMGLATNPHNRIVMEDVGSSMPGNAAKSARTFADHCGALKMALVVLGVPHELVQPRKWLAGLFGESYPKGPSPAQKKERKHFIYERMQREYPAAEFTLRQADAVAIMHWARLKYERSMGR
jgi:hypothetical protein